MYGEHVSISDVTETRAEILVWALISDWKRNAKLMSSEIRCKKFVALPTLRCQPWVSPCHRPVPLGLKQPSGEEWCGTTCFSHPLPTQKPLAKPRWGCVGRSLQSEVSCLLVHRSASPCGRSAVLISQGCPSLTAQQLPLPSLLAPCWLLSRCS